MPKIQHNSEIYNKVFKDIKTRNYFFTFIVHLSCISFLRVMIGRSNISGIHPEILLVHGKMVILLYYHFAMDKQYFRMNSGNIASP
jgi:hypothetical protein